MHYIVFNILHQKLAFQFLFLVESIPEQRKNTFIYSHKKAKPSGLWPKESALCV